MWQRGRYGNSTKEGEELKRAIAAYWEPRHEELLQEVARLVEVHYGPDGLSLRKSKKQTKAAAAADARAARNSSRRNLHPSSSEVVEGEPIRGWKTKDKKETVRLIQNYLRKNWMCEEWLCALSSAIWSEQQY